jgi:hypothetical protein
MNVSKVLVCGLVPRFMVFILDASIIFSLLIETFCYGLLRRLMIMPRGAVRDAPEIAQGGGRNGG